jgi:glucosamine--fructose-6-phosphate aminotransferase (isomerizing)
MCGIFGYIGTKNNAANLVLNGLKTLEYRGYDSWGIAEVDGKKIVTEKHVGKIGQGTTILPESSLAIGHTRWATHGGVTITNAHPHLDCTKKLALIHNGIVENYIELKEELIKKKHSFNSETDTEVVVHLIEEYAKKYEFATAVRLAFTKLKGLNAIVAISVNKFEIVACKNGSPLVVGIGDKELFIASDAVGIIPHTKKVIFLKDNEMVVLGDAVSVFLLSTGDRITPEIEIIDWKREEGTMGNFPHFMIKEIYDQDHIIRHICKNLLSEIEQISTIVKKARGTFFIGAGTAYHACLAGTYLFAKIAKMHVNTAVASEFNYLEDFLTSESLIIALSQSGETIDVIEPLQRAKEKGTKIVAMVNNLGSTIYRMSDHKILLNAGPELAVASTKAYIAKLALLLLLVGTLSGQQKRIQNLLLKSAEEIKRLLTNNSKEKIKKIAQLLANKEHIYTIGRGVSYPTALEAALKIKEVSYIHTEGLAGGELKHGTIALISKGTPCIVFAPLDETHGATISNATEIKARGGVIIGISPKKSTVFDYWIKVQDLQEATILAQIVPAQLLAYFLALEKDVDPDKPRNLAKSVTVK